MGAYLRAFVNCKHINRAKQLPIAKFAYNNAKNTSTRHIPFEHNCGFHSQVLFKEDVDLRSKSRLANKLADELRELMKICCQNLLHAQKLQKRAHIKRIKNRSYILGKKI